MSEADSSIRARLLFECKNLVGESPVWDVQRNGLWWIDIRAPALHFHGDAESEDKIWPMPTTIGFVVLCNDGLLVVGLNTGLHLFDPESGKFQVLLNPLEGTTSMRLNEGQVDPDGRLWFGIMHDRGEVPVGMLMRWEPGRDLVVLRENLNIPNGLSFGKDDSLATFTDSSEGRLLRIGEDGKEFAEFFPAVQNAGVPDGAVRDADDHVWLARFGGNCVLRISPDGQVVQRIEVPAPNVTSVTLGGADGRDLFITTARLRLTEAELAQWPQSGSLFSARVQVPGVGTRRLSSLV